MLTYDLSKIDGSSLYDKLYRAIRDDIAAGVLLRNEKLPSKRSLAQHLRLSVITVENAYAQLLAEGYIYAMERKGYFVSEIEEIAKPPEKSPPGEREDAPKPPELFLNLQSNSISAEHFPFSIWLRIMRSAINEKDKRILDDTGFRGSDEFRRAISEYLYRFRGTQILPEQIIIGAGTEYLYNLLIQLLGHDKIYAIETPGHTKVAKVYNVNGVQCRYVELDDNGMNISRLEESGADIAHISPAHHFPTGIVMPISRRRELLQWAAEREGRFIIEDDYDSEFRFSGRPIPTLLSTDTQGTVIYMNTFSKTIAPSMRISYMILPPQLLERYAERMSFYSCTVPALEQYTLAKFISGGHFEKHIRRMKNLYRTKRDNIIAAVKNSSLSGRVTIMEEDSGLHFLLRFDTDIKDSALTSRAAEAGIRIACLSDYLREPEERYEHIAVINYSGADEARFEEGMERLAKTIYG